jgi:hypothetical protein
MAARAGRTLWHELQFALRSAWDARLALLLGTVAVLLTLAAQLPVRYHIEVGQEDGPGSDLPLISGFLTPEHSADGVFTWRWTTDRSVVQLPGVGQRSLGFTLRVLGLNDEMKQHGPQVLELWANGQHIAQLPVYQAGATYHVLVPPPPDGSGNQQLEIHSTTFSPTGDVRSLGVPVDDIEFTSGSGALPAWPALITWMGVAALLWLAVRGMGFRPRTTLLLLLPLALLLGLAAALDPPRTAMAAAPMLIAVAIGWLFSAALHLAVPPLARWLRVPLDERMLRVLLLLVLLVFSMRFGGKIYPDSMPGDIGFHYNRFVDVISGTVLLLSRNRGVDFPYPPAFYLIVAPFSLPGIDPHVLIRLFTTLLDATSPLLVYAIAVTAACWISAPSERESAALPAWPLLAAGIYSLSASGFMTTWWNFSTHIFAQWAHLLLITALVLFWRADNQDVQPARMLPIFVVLQSLVFFGHFGFWMNMSLLGGTGIVLLLAGSASHARRAWLNRRTWLLMWSFIVAQIVVVLFFYSGYTELFIQQAQATAHGGLTGLAGRQPASTAALWNTLWNFGLRTHFGLFPIPMALAGLVLFWQRRQAARRAMLLFLIAGTFLLGLGFAILPFVSGSTLTTRWLMFSAWAIAVAAAWCAEVLWRSGRASRWLVVAAGSYMIWITMSQWIGALAWRIRPPEPF